MSYKRVILFQMPVMVPVIMGVPMFMDDLFVPMLMVMFFSYERYCTDDHNRQSDHEHPIGRFLKQDDG